MLHICCELLFVYWSFYDGKKKKKTNAINKLSEIKIRIKF